MAPETEERANNETGHSAWATSIVALDVASATVQGARLLLIVPETPEFRAAARAHSRPDDTALEVGCSYGEATAVLVERGCRSIVGVDNSLECLRHVRETLLPSQAGGRLRLQLLDCLRYPCQLSALAAATAPSLLLLDIGGNRDLASVAATLLALESSGVAPRLVIVKSRELYAAISQVAGGSTGTAPGAASGAADAPGTGPAAANIVRWGELRSTIQEAAAPARTGWAAASDDVARPLAGAAAAAGSAVPELDVMAEHNPDCAPGQTQLCHAFLTRGRCARTKGCGFRHLLPGHPAAEEDVAKRSRLGWLPERLVAKAARELGEIVQPLTGEGERGRKS